MASTNTTTGLEPFYALPKEYRNVEAVIRLASVKRWHMLDTTKVQSLSEHSANVAALVYTVAVTAPDMFFGPSEFITTRALFHDIGEVFSGDIPTPTKNYGTEIRGAIEDLETALGGAMVQNTYLLPHQKLLIKLCDLADGIRFIRLHGVGSTAAHAQTGLSKQLKARFDDMSDWPKIVRRHVSSMVMFYAYEGS